MSAAQKTAEPGQLLNGKHTAPSDEALLDRKAKEDAARILDIRCLKKEVALAQEAERVAKASLAKMEKELKKARDSEASLKAKQIAERTIGKDESTEEQIAKLDLSLKDLHWAVERNLRVTEQSHQMISSLFAGIGQGQSSLVPKIDTSQMDQMSLFLRKATREAVGGVLEAAAEGPRTPRNVDFQGRQQSREATELVLLQQQMLHAVKGLQQDLKQQPRSGKGVPNNHKASSMSAYHSTAPMGVRRNGEGVEMSSEAPVSKPLGDVESGLSSPEIGDAVDEPVSAREQPSGADVLCVKEEFLMPPLECPVEQPLNGHAKDADPVPNTHEAEEEAEEVESRAIDQQLEDVLKPEITCGNDDPRGRPSFFGGLLRQHKMKRQMASELHAGEGLHHGKSQWRLDMEESILERLAAAVFWWESIEEPKRSGALHRLVASSAFEGLSALAIVVNSGFVAYTTDWQMVNYPSPDPEIFATVELGFMVFYTVELGCRLGEHRLYFFANHDMKWNWFDFILVSLSLFDFTVGVIMAASGQTGGNLAFMRILRLCKLAKILRALRAVRFFKDLAVMLDSFRASFVALFWSSVMLIFMLYIFALVFLQAVVDFCVMFPEEVTPEFKADAEMYFGSMPKTIVSLYMAVTGGNDWIIFYRIIQYASHLYAFVFLFFTFFFEFALFNIMTGMFVEKAVMSSTPDRNEVVLQQRQKAQKTADEFRHICNVLDKDGSGTISWQEFAEHMKNEVVATYMAGIGLEVREIELFFNIVAGCAEEGEITIDQFVDGCMQMKGGATAIDMQRSLFELNRMHRDVKRFETRCLVVLEQIGLALQAFPNQALSMRSMG